MGLCTVHVTPYPHSHLPTNLHSKSTTNVGKYISPMDLMGYKAVFRGGDSLRLAISILLT